MRQHENVGRNDVTGDKLRSKTGDASAFSKGWDLLQAGMKAEREAAERQKAKNEEDKAN
jgi:hypothetical protein